MGVGEQEQRQTNGDQKPAQRHNEYNSKMPKAEVAAAIDNKKLTFPVDLPKGSRFAGKLRYCWSWFVAGALLLFIATPALLFLWIIKRRIWLYPLALWGARTWLAASGVTVKVTGIENLNPD